jgi:hypothetical protein
MANPDSSVIQVDDYLSEADSSYGSDESQTTSLKSSIYNFVYENGRRYHTYRQGVYWYGLHPARIISPNSMLAQDNRKPSVH